jgi:DNA mismatch repair protein MutS
MQQYYRIKKENPDTILFFRMGDFYEMFDADAREASALLCITLTKRNNVPMCGIPYHSCRGYINRLLKAGKKIAICEQVPSVRETKGLMERQVIEIITPGTVTEEDLLEKGQNNFLVCFARSRDALCLAYLDLLTAEFYLAAYPLPASEPEALGFLLRRELQRLNPREVLIQESLFEDENLARIFSEQNQIMINRYPDWSFDRQASAEKLKRQFKVSNLKGFGLDDDDQAVLPAGLLLEYVENASRSLLPHIKGVKLYRSGHYMDIDEASFKSLEIITNNQTGSARFSLLEVLNRTRTAMGSRKLRSWLLHPLVDPEQINARLDRVEFLYRRQNLLAEIQEQLKSLYDLERLSSRLAMDKASPRDLIAVRQSLRVLEALNEKLLRAGALPLFHPVNDEHSQTLKELAGYLENSIHDEPSLVLNEGRLIKPGFDPKLDEIKTLRQNSRQILNAYLEEEKKLSGIPQLKIRYNRIIGYFLELSKGGSASVPDHYIRRQSLVSSERFSTRRLVELEADLNTAEDRAVEMEKELFLKVRSRAREAAGLLLEAAEEAANLDVYTSLALMATQQAWTRPVIDNSQRLFLREARHPVVESYLPPGEFVANSLSLNFGEVSFALITGPNMSGKSTFLRQTALIVLMAQIGSFVPAAEAVVGCVDRIFCRVGAWDNLARGESTFLVEMNETAYILRTATPRSLVIMDEVGRGTGTADGLSIARAVGEYLFTRIGCKTLFATHYHELTTLEDPAVINLSLEVLDNHGEIIFLKRIKKGPAENSYGIQVARLAGLPQEVIRRAQEILLTLTQGKAPDLYAGLKDSPAFPASGQGDLFSPGELLVSQLSGLNPDTLSPREALDLLYRWKNSLAQK